ncbi:MAG: ABC transporter ATP-binding protein [Deltaproteobacteria bacterium]|nr:ABC transporter ATP-binding protein [Deltaproteobacteria bacterium]
MTILECKCLSKRFDEPAVRDVSLSLAKGRILCLLGPSGCGKTTLLRLIAGLENPDRGRVIFAGKDLTRRPAHQRQFGMMFQDFALFPHKNVFQNVAFGLQMLNMDPGKAASLTDEMLELTGLADLGRRDVASLSGGEKQRVALARSLAPRPRLLMLDEPMGSLDRALRERLLPEIRNLLKQLKMTAIFVTHDQSEAFGIADEIAVMNKGQIMQQAVPEDLYRFPASVFVAEFLGFNNLLPGAVNAEGAIDTALGALRPSSCHCGVGAAVTVLLPPECAALTPPAAGTDVAIIQGEVLNRTFAGRCYRVRIGTGSFLELTFDLANHDPPPLVGEKIVLYLNIKMITVI